MNRHYCCCFDHRYIPRALAMIRSLRNFERHIDVWVLCLSDECHRIMSAIAEPGVRLITMSEFERDNRDLVLAKTNRSVIEYYFTCTPSLVCYVMSRVANGDLVIYVDGDLYFVADPEPLFAELGDGAVSIVPHRFAPKAQHLDRFGLYNVGWLVFRNDARGASVADWWRRRCNEWCYDFPDGDRFADQKYLEQFAAQSEGVIVLRHPGANLAPWNLGRHALSLERGEITVDGARLIFFHFHGMRTLGRVLYLTEHHRYGAPFNGFVRRHLYRPYVQALATIRAEVATLQHTPTTTLWRYVSGRSSTLNRMFGGIKRPGRNLLSILSGQFILVVRGKAI
jgi:hypothetical protein